MTFDAKTCAVCAKTWTPTSRYQAARNQTCGPTCSAVLIGRARAATRKPPAERPGMVEETCPTCGTRFHLPRAWRKRNAAAYCSPACRSATFADRLRPLAGNMKGRKRENPKTGADNPAWKGGVTLRRRRGNYVSVRYVRCPPELATMARTDGYVMEHRLVMARLCRRALTRTECVHHLDHDPLNNAPGNLELWPDNRSHKLAEHGRIAIGAANLWCPTV